MAADKTEPADGGSYTGENPHQKFSQAWHAWNYLKRVVDKDRKNDVKVDQLPKGWSHPDFDEHGKRVVV